MQDMFAVCLNADRARKHGMDAYIQADPCKFDLAALFKTQQTLTLDYRLNDLFASRGWFSPGQLFVLDEYWARYGVRGCDRHLCSLHGLLERSEKAVAIDPTSAHYSFAFCASHVHGNRISQSIHKNFEKEQWKPHGHGCDASEDMLWKLDTLQTFVFGSALAGRTFAKHLEQRLKTHGG